MRIASGTNLETHLKTKQAQLGMKEFTVQIESNRLNTGTGDGDEKLAFPIAENHVHGEYISNVDQMSFP